jgi:hypothetical protein
MTGAELPILKIEIEKELKELERLCGEMEEVARRREPSFIEVRAAGSILHDFYCGVEKIFKKIASRIDRDIPSGEDWHLQLLERMTLDLPGLRPAVIGEQMKNRLSEYLRFRHLFRNIYGFELRWILMEELGHGMREVLTALQQAIERFLDFIQSMQENL